MSICAKCNQKTDDNNTYVCEECGRTFHPKCVAYDYAGSGEYPDEDAYCLCEECVPK